MRNIDHISRAVSVPSPAQVQLVGRRCKCAHRLQHFTQACRTEKVRKEVAAAIIKGETSRASYHVAEEIIQCYRQKSGCSLSNAACHWPHHTLTPTIRFHFDIAQTII